MGSDFMPCRRDPADKTRERFRHASQDEKGCPHVVFGKKRKEPFRVRQHSPFGGKLWLLPANTADVKPLLYIHSQRINDVNRLILFPFIVFSRNYIISRFKSINS
jgi:hypothetical protein